MAGTPNTFRKMLDLSEVKWNESVQVPTAEELVTQNKLFYQIVGMRHRAQISGYMTTLLIQFRICCQFKCLNNGIIFTNINVIIHYFYSHDF